MLYKATGRLLTQNNRQNFKQFARETVHNGSFFILFREMSKRKVGIVGYGSLGQFLAHKILEDQKISAELEISFVWNRSTDKIISDPKIDKKLILEDLSQFPSRGAGMRSCRNKINI